MKPLEKASIYWVYDQGLSLKYDQEGRILNQLLESGLIDILQFRAKNITFDSYLFWCEKLLKSMPKSATLVLANDFCDAVNVLDLDGVHIGQNDLPLPLARELLPKKIIGATARSLETARAATDYADYLGVGTVFETSTKEGLKPAGPDFVLKVANESSLPIFPIGGINSENVQILKKSKIHKVAVASCLLTADSPIEELRSIAKHLQQ